MNRNEIREINIPFQYFTSGEIINYTIRLSKINVIGYNIIQKKNYVTGQCRS